MPTVTIEICSTDNCESPVRNRKRQLCNACYLRLLRNGTVEYQDDGSPKYCIIEDCDRRLSAGSGRLMCSLHYQRFRKYGNPNILKRKHERGICTISDCDSVCYSSIYCDKHYRRFKKYGDPNFLMKDGSGWVNRGYKYLWINDKSVGESRLIMEKKLGRKLKQKEVIHHKDGNTLNNNESNLELFSSQSEHARFHYEMRGSIRR
ncbi:MAG TPA: hypothetical protein DHN29_06020 [Cytophagales bacterium]|nr:hypothetical protein [Cytophagales bacterium]|tara:strand:+ start:765 stop:1379 length:615 start_codon:yes stop_codon:yes gene_type:complete